MDNTTIQKFLDEHDYDIRKTHNGRWMIKNVQWMQYAWYLIVLWNIPVIERIKDLQ